MRDWQGLLRGHVHQAQQLLRRLVKGRLVFTPHESVGKSRGYYTFEGVGTVRPLLAGVVQKLASPSGSDAELDAIFLDFSDLLKVA